MVDRELAGHALKLPPRQRGIAGHLKADVAHEMGTPITTVASAAEIALRHPRHRDEYRAVLQQVVDESRHMGRLVDDLLLLARADAGWLPLEREIVELDEVCRQAVRL